MRHGTPHLGGCRAAFSEVMSHFDARINKGLTVDGLSKNDAKKPAESAFFESPVTGCPPKLCRCCEPTIEDPERRSLGNFEAAYDFSPVASPPVLHQRLRPGPLPIRAAPVASGWSNRCRGGISSSHWIHAPFPWRTIIQRGTFRQKS
jgi:hypothetical protein